MELNKLMFDEIINLIELNHFSDAELKVLSVI